MPDTLDEARKGDLYALLALCTKEDLDPLVVQILGKTSNFLDINENYKKFQPDHTRYHKVVADEIRLYGGNSLRNLVRGNEGPPYDEIVIDVCKKLDVPYEEGNTPKNEANLLDIFVEKRWRSLDPNEREKLASEARDAAMDKISDLNSIGKAAASFAIGRLLTGPAGWALLGISILDAAYKVTVPCVLHIAYLRRKILEEKRAHSPLALTSQIKPEATKQSSALAIHGDDGKPILSMARISEPSVGRWHEIDDTDDGISRLSPLLQLVPSLTTAAEVATGKYYQVVTNGQKLMRIKETGVLKAVTIGRDGKITGLADIIKPDRLSAMVNTSALISVASVVLAQKHLADISKKLSDLKDSVDAIRQFQKAERRSVLTGSIRYFEQVAPSVLAGELPDRMLQQIERFEGDLLRVQDHLTDEIRTETDALQKLEDDEWFGSQEMTQTIEDRQKLLSALYRELLLCIRARACGWQLLCAFPGEEMSKENRRRDIQSSLDGLETCGEMLTKTDEFLRRKIHDLSSFWNKTSTVNERKLALLQASENLLDAVAAGRSGIQRDLQEADAMLAALKEPVAMAVRIEGDRIAAIQAL